MGTFPQNLLVPDTDKAPSLHGDEESYPTESAVQAPTLPLDTVCRVDSFVRGVLNCLTGSRERTWPVVSWLDRASYACGIRTWWVRSARLFGGTAGRR